MKEFTIYLYIIAVPALFLLFTSEVLYHAVRPEVKPVHLAMAFTIVPIACRYTC
ncbi:MAG: hypothetical protein R2759_18255 [Bacteroidales bacterium]